MNRTTFLAACVIAAGVFGSPANATPSECAGATVVAADETACMQRLADGVYVILHDDATDEWPHSNTGVIEGRSSLFVIDSTYLPSRAEADIALIRQITSKPVRYLTTTHWHMDHNNGAVSYMRAFPQLTYLVEANTARWMTLNQRWYARFSTVDDSARRAGVAALERQLAEGHDANSATLSEDGRAALTALIARRRGELDELSRLDVIEPTRTFTGSMTLNFEGRRVEIHNWGRANSPSDTTFYLPRERVLFTGDILVNSPLPYVGASYPRDWRAVLDALAEIPANAVVTGHGPVYADHTYTRQVRALMDAAVTRVDAALAQGLSLDQAKEQITLDDVRMAGWRGSRVSDEDWAYTHRTLIERAWQNIRGQET